MIPLEVKDDEGKSTKRTVKDIYTDLKAMLKIPGLWNCLDYFEIAIGKKRQENVRFPHFGWLSCSPVRGRNGSHYIHIGTITKGRYSLIFEGRTSQGFHAACEVANLCAEQLRA